MRGRIISKLLIVILSVMLLNPVLTAGGAYAIDAQRESGVETSMLTFEHMPEELADWICEDNQTQINLDCSDAEELNNLTVINNDGTKTTRFFNRPIKYVENNQIKFIDNSFKKSNKAKSFFTTYKYENSQSDVKLYLPAKIKDGLLMQSGDMNLRLTPVIKSNSEAVLKDFTFAGKTQQIAEYANAFGEGAHLQYASVSGGLKENILLESCVDGVFEFKLSIPGYYAILSDRGVKISLYSYDQPDAGPKYVISQPYALDSYQGEPDGKAHVAFDNKYELIQTGNSEYTIKMLIDEDFLQSSDTVYPVLIDPSIAYASSGSIEDTYVCEANGIKYNNDSLLRLGADSDPLYGRMSIYIKNNFMWYFRYIRPENITSVRYYTERIGVSTLSGMSASVYDCTNVHSLSQVTYAQLENSTGALQSNSIVDIAHTLCEFNVTSLTKQWLKNLLSEGGKSYNYGFIIKAAPSTNGYMCLRAADDPAGNYPCFEITYNEDTSIAYGTFYIRNKQSGQYLDVYNLGTASGTSIIQFPFNGGYNQMWQITHQNNGLYTIRPKHAPSMYLQVSGGTNVDNSRVIQGSYNSQYPYYNWWRIIKNANGTYRLIPYISTILALDNNASSANGANILIGDYYGYAYQQWELLPAVFLSDGDKSICYTTAVTEPTIPIGVYDALDAIEVEYNVWPAGNISKFYGLSDAEREDRIITLTQNAYAVVLGGTVVGQSEAAECMEHFLNCTGAPFMIDFKKMNNETDAADFRKDDVNMALRAAELLSVPGQIVIFSSLQATSHEVYAGNWGRAIGGYSTKIKCSVTQDYNGNYSAIIEYCLYDVYDWDRTDPNKFMNIISPQELWEIQYAGYGKGYYVYGIDTLNIRWCNGQRWDSGAEIIDME